jgi:hypothetical protein
MGRGHPNQRNWLLTCAEQEMRREMAAATGCLGGSTPVLHHAHRVALLEPGGKGVPSGAREQRRESGSTEPSYGIGEHKTEAR